MKPFLHIVFAFASTFLLAQASSSAPPHKTQAKHGTMTVRRPYGEEVTMDRVVYKVVEQMPVFPGGYPALQAYLSSVPYPIDMLNAGLSGRAYVQFVIEADGNTSGHKIVSSTVPQSGQDAALYHIINMPRWQPGKQRGQPVAVQMVIPFKFKIN